MTRPVTEPRSRGPLGNTLLIKPIDRLYSLLIYIYTYSRSKNELLDDIFLWTPPHGRTSVGRPASTYLNQLSVGCGLEKLLGAINDQDRLREGGKSVLSVLLDDNDYIYIYIYIS